MSAFIEYPIAKQKVKIASCSGCWQRSFRYSQHQNSSKNAKFWFMTTIWSCVKLWRRKPGTNKIYCSTNCHKIPHIQCLYTFIMPPGPQISPSSYESILCKNGYIHILFKPNNLYPIRKMKSQLGDSNIFCDNQGQTISSKCASLWPVSVCRVSSRRMSGSWRFGLMAILRNTDWKQKTKSSKRSLQLSWRKIFWKQKRIQAQVEQPGNLRQFRCIQSELNFGFISNLILSQEENITSASDSEPRKDKRRPSFNRSKSLDQEVQRKLDRQQSSDTETRVATGQGWGRAEANGHLPHRSLIRHLKVLSFIHSFFTGAEVKHIWQKRILTGL